MIKVVFLPEDEYFEQNIFELCGSKAIHHVDVIVDGQATYCDHVRVMANGLFGFTKHLSLGEFRVKMSAITRVTFYLEV